MVYSNIKNIYKNKISLGDDFERNYQDEINKYNILIIGSKYSGMKKIISSFIHNKKSKKIIINIFGDLKIKSNKKLKIINI